MTIQIEDIAPLIKKEKEDRNAKQLEQLRLQVGVGTAVSEIQGDPKWSIYLGHQNALLDSAEQQVRGYEQSLGSGEFLTPEKYGQIKVKLADSRGFVRGMRQSMALLTDLINNGEKAAEQTFQLTKNKILE